MRVILSALQVKMYASASNFNLVRLQINRAWRSRRFSGSNIELPTVPAALHGMPRQFTLFGERGLPVRAAIFEGEVFTFDICDRNGRIQTIDGELPDLPGRNVIDAT
jgi:hypothetical protein